MVDTLKKVKTGDVLVTPEVRFNIFQQLTTISDFPPAHGKHSVSCGEN